jgi:hypothetical protein
VLSGPGGLMSPPLAKRNSWLLTTAVATPGATGLLQGAGRGDVGSSLYYLKSPKAKCDPAGDTL